MFKTIKYIGALAVVGLSLTACSDGIFTDSEEYTISGTGEKSPLEMSVTLKDAYRGPSTRAFDTKFENNDVLVAYVQQVKGTMSSDTPPVFTLATESPVVIYSKVEFTVKEAGTGIDVVKSANHSTQIYWDDFSSTTDDIRDYDRYLRVGYGFCYNGRIASDYTESTDGTTVTWSVKADQTSGIKTSDLLWAGPQEVRHYNHDSFKPGATEADKKAVILPVVYEHAMSKVTLELVLSDGFENISAEQINAIAPKLYANISASVKADNKTITPTVVSAPGTEISMFKVGPKTENSKTYYIYEALIAPTAMVDGKKLAEVTVAGNKYDLVLTTTMLESTTIGNQQAWSTKLGTSGVSLPGVNYHLRATLKKQRIEVEANIMPWNEVYAAGDGMISFDADVAQNGDLDADLTPVTAGSFDLWRATSNSAELDYDYNTSNNTSSTTIDKASTYTYSSTTNKWEGDPAIYWENQSTSYYFRALAKATAYADDGKVTTISTVGGSTSVSQSNTKSETVDLLWAQTSEHKGLDANSAPIIDTQTGVAKVYDAGAAIDPRTGNVPLTFKHAMSKISVNLQTSKVEAEKVDLTGATISIINLYNGGTIKVSDGKIVNMSAPTAGGEPMTVKDIAVADMKDYLIIPQSLVNLEDGTERTSTPVFYSADQLTAIYANGSSLASAGETTPTNYYLTNQLTPVPNEYFSATEVKEFNRTLDGHKEIGGVRVPGKDAVLYTSEEFISGNIHKTFTQEQFDLLEDDDHKKAKLKSDEKEAEYFETLTEFKAFINTEYKYSHLPESFRKKTDATGETPAEYYYYSDFIDTNNATLFTDRLSALDNQYKTKSPAKDPEYYDYQEYTTHDGIINETMFNALPVELKIKEPAVDPVLYQTQEEVDEDNELLPGAIHTTDIKIPAHYVLPTGTPLTPHAPGSLQTIGNKIMLYVFLQDGTRYSAELSKCLETKGKDSEGKTIYGQAVDEWKSNHHYTYTITLAKEKISFQALVKEWEEKTVGGNATLDW